MAPGIFHELPAELLAGIVRDLPLDALRHLSAVNSRLRQFLIPALFSTIRISNRPADEDTVAKVSAKYGRHVRGVHLIVDLEALADSPLRADEDEKSVEGDDYRASFGMPGWARKFLTGQTLPAVSSVTIQFALAAGSTNPVRPLDAAMGETDTWRLRLDDMWLALAENPRIRRLAVRNLVLVKSVAWFEPAWRAFLNRLVTLELGLWADQPAVDRGDYQSFQYFQLRHFYGPPSSEPAALRRFALLEAPSSYRPDRPMLGNGNDAGEAPLALAPTPPPPYLWTAPADCMPHLRELRVEYCVVDAGLAAFIAERGRASLRAVELVDCVALVDDMNAVVDFSWEAFFDAILAAGVTRGGGGDPRSGIVALEEFVLMRTRPVALIDEGRWRGTRPEHDSFLEAEEDERRRVWRVRDRVRGLRLRNGGGGGGRAFNEAEVLFPYVALPGMGPSVEQEGFNLLRAEDGGDAAACRRLMEAVMANRDRRVAGQ